MNICFKDYSIGCSRALHVHACRHADLNVLRGVLVIMVMLYTYWEMERYPKLGKNSQFTLSQWRHNKKHSFLLMLIWRTKAKWISQSKCTLQNNCIRILNLIVGQFCKKKWMWPFLFWYIFINTYFCFFINTSWVYPQRFKFLIIRFNTCGVKLWHNAKHYLTQSCVSHEL